MSDYGLNFGFRRSEPSVREGRLRVPLTGTLYQGDLVTYDKDAPGFLKLAAATSALQPGFTGLLEQEEGWDISAFGAPNVDSFSKGKALNGKPAVIHSGAGNKVWLKNTPTQTRFDGRVIAARTIITMAGVTAIGDELEWSGTAWIKKSAGAAVLRVTFVGTDYVEAVLVG